MKTVMTCMLAIGAVVGLAGVIVVLFSYEKSGIPHHSHVYEENGRYFFRKGNPETVVPTEISRESFNIYHKYKSIALAPLLIGVPTFMVSTFYFAIQGMIKGRKKPKTL